MDNSKKMLAQLSELGVITLPKDLSEEDLGHCSQRLIEFANQANAEVEALRVDFHSLNGERIEKRILSIKNELHYIHSLRLENECDSLIRHIRLQGVENSLIRAEILISHLLELSINIQVTRHNSLKETPVKMTVSTNKPLLTVLLGQLRQAMDEFNDEKSLQILEKLEPFDLGEKMTAIKKFVSSFEFDKAASILTELRSLAQDEKELRKKVILAVDDMPQLLTPLKAMIGDGYKFVGATSGEAALKYLENNLPDVYILDIDMPGMNGFQLVEAIRAKRKIAPIIFLTANATVDYVTKAFDLGISDFLVKPCNEESVHAKLGAIFFAQK